MKILLKCYLQFKFHGTGVIFAMVTMFPHFPPKCGACVNLFVYSIRGFVRPSGHYTQVDNAETLLSAFNTCATFRRKMIC